MDENEIILRVSRVETGSVDWEGRSIRMVLASQNPVMVYVPGKGKMAEVICMDGMEVPESRQVPLDDSHRGSESVAHVIGSIRELHKKNGLLHGTAVFARSVRGDEALANYRDGHLTDFSVTAQPLEVKYEGGTRFVLRSLLVGGAACTVGADPVSKAQLSTRRYSDPDGCRRDCMNEALMQMLVKRGLSATATETEAQTFLERLLSAPAGNDGSSAAGDLEAIANERKRISEIDTLCRTHAVAEPIRRKLIDNGSTVADASTEILRSRYAGGVPVGPGQHISGGASEVEKVTSGMEAAITRRMLQGQGLSAERVLERAKAAGDIDAVQVAEGITRSLSNPAGNDFRYMRMPELARCYLQAAGQNVMGLPPATIITRALQHQGFQGLLQRSDGPAYHSTGSFANLTLNSATKTLRMAWEEAPATYQLWAREAEASDYRDLHRMRLGELDDPQIVPPNTNYPESTTSDSKETYSIDKVGQVFSFPLELWVNDDLDSMSRIPASQGAAMRRRVNRAVYAVLTGNAALSDGVALFHSDHNNTASNALSAAGAMGAAFAKLAKQTGVNSNVVLNIIGRYLICPVALSETALTLVNSFAPPSATHSGTANIYGPGGARPMTVVIEPQLDLNSLTKWYMTCHHSQCDTVEVSFLQGEKTPVLEQEAGFINDTLRFKIRQSFAAKAIDHRGMVESTP